MVSAEQERTTVLAAAVLVLVLVAVVMFALYGGRGRGGRPPAGPNPCKSQKMPVLDPGLSCHPAGGGSFAWLTAAAPTAAGVAAPPTLKPIKTVVSGDDYADCVTESACQGFCLDEPTCVMYSFDASGQAPTPKCQSAGATCVIYSGTLPGKIGAAATPYVTGGIPKNELPVKIE